MRVSRVLSFLIVVLLGLTFWPTGPVGSGHGVGAVFEIATADAQEAKSNGLTEEDYDAWEKDAQRAEASLDNHLASDSAFESLRSDLVEWRSRFQTEQLRNADRIATLAAQIEALGPAPEEGATESAELSARRAELQNEYNDLVAPVRKAEEAYTRANGLIARVDSLLRSRQADKLLQRGPSPVVPQNILTTAEDLYTVWRVVLSETTSAISLRSEAVLLRDNFLHIVVLLALALLLLVRGRHWFKRLVDWTMTRGSGGQRTIVAAMVMSLGQVILPVLGIVFLTAALIVSGLFGAKGEGLLGAIPFMGAAFFAARWLGGQTFPTRSDWPMILDLSRKERLRGRFYSSSLGVLFAAAIFVSTLVTVFPLQTETGIVLAFPVIALASICLAGIARLMISHGLKGEAEEHQGSLIGTTTDERSFVDRSILLTGRACLFIAFAAPALSVIGYTRAAVFLALSPSLTLAILATVSFLQRLAMGIFRMLTSPSRDPSDGLLPVLVNFTLLILSLPFIAMVWGVRKADLLELWVTIRTGVKVGDTLISPTVVLVFAIAFAAGMLVTRLVQSAMRASILPRTSIDPGGQKAMISGLGYLGVFLSAMIAVGVAGLDLSNIAIVAGALSVGVGFGLQSIVSNFVAGLILLIERPVTEGDWIEVGGVMGTVKKISVRATTVETFDKTDVVVPNGDFIAGQVTNWTRGNLSGRLILQVGVAYGTDTRKVATILQEIAEAHPLVIVNPPPLIVFQGFGADSLDFEMRVILRDINFGLGTRTELNHQIAERFAEEGIEIPFAQRDIWLRNPEALRGPANPTPMEPVPAVAPATDQVAPLRPDPAPEFPTEDDT